jgi:hypothetical protein
LPAHFEIDSNTSKKILSGVLKDNSSKIIKMLFDKSTKFKFMNNTIEVKVIMFKFFLTLEKFPYSLNGVYEFSHNIPIDKINLKDLPKNIIINKNRIFINVPENIISKNIVLKNLKFDDDKIIVDLSY